MGGYALTNIKFTLIKTVIWGLINTWLFMKELLWNTKHGFKIRQNHIFLSPKNHNFLFQITENGCPNFGEFLQKSSDEAT